MRFVIGVDGGASKTHAMIADLEGSTLGFAVAGPSNMYDAPMDLALGEAELAVRAAAREAGVEPSHAEAAVFSMCGADWPEDFTLIQEWLATRRLGRSIAVLNDAVGGLWAGSESGPAVSVICGTGVAIASRNGQGDLWHTSFWQGSGGAVHLAEKALSMVIRAELGVEPPTELQRVLPGLFSCDSVEDMLHCSTRLIDPRALDRGKIIRALLSEASSGDAASLKLVQDHGIDLGRYAVAALRKVAVSPDACLDVVLGGSVIRYGGAILPAGILVEIGTHFPNARAMYLTHDPVIGAVRYAINALFQV